jgi:hypothetical protein
MRCSSKVTLLVLLLPFAALILFNLPDSRCEDLSHHRCARQRRNSGVAVIASSSFYACGDFGNQALSQGGPSAVLSWTDANVGALAYRAERRWANSMKGKAI